MKIVVLHKYTIEIKDECVIVISKLIIKTKTEFITDNLYQLCVSQ